MRSLLFCVSILFCLSSCTHEQKHEDIERGWEQMEVILQGINAPEFADQRFCILDYGASQDGELCTEAFRQAIEACHQAGGGRVIVPEGEFVSGAIHLLSNVELHLEEGAKILFSTNPMDYLPNVRTRFEGCELYNYSPLIYAYKQENIAITGDGVLDGQASMDNWWHWKRGHEDKSNSQQEPNSNPRLLEMMTNGVPVEERIFGDGYYLRPSFIQPFECKNILIEGVTLVRPPMWMIHPVLSENITIRDVKLFSQGAPNGDGCDPESCKNIMIEGCEFNNGDDCIAIKSGRNRQGYDAGIPTENVIIRHCKMLDGHGGVVIGSESSGGARNIYAYDCEMSSPNLDRALRLKSNKYRGGVIENIYLRDITVGEVKNAAVRINQNYSSKTTQGEIKYTRYRNIFIERMVCNKADYAIQIMGLEALPIENVKLIDCQFNNIKKDNVLEYVNDLVLENVTVDGKQVSPILDL